VCLAFSAPNWTHSIQKDTNWNILPFKRQHHPTIGAKKNALSYMAVETKTKASQGNNPKLLTEESNLNDSVCL
jgi:hypothetical protein